jgi:UDP-N-acetylmuramate dehydrogenase
MFPDSVPHRENEPLAKYTTYRIGGPAHIFALPRHAEDLAAIGAYLKGTGDKYFVLGNGSNVLAPDEGFDGVVICTREMNPGIEFLASNQVRASAATLNSRILRATAEAGLAGLEPLSGVPGNVGGAIYMNAGTGAGWIDRVTIEVDVASLSSGKVRSVAGPELSFSYRHQHFLEPDEIILSATFQLAKEEPAAVKARHVELVKKRKAAQPIEMPSCGSVFRNPQGQNAWKVISDVGLKGHRIGGARFSEKHSNFIVNEGGATRADVLELIRLAKNLVQEKLGISLREEVVLLEGKTL